MKILFALAAIILHTVSFSQWSRVENLPATDIISLYNDETALYAGGNNVIYVSRNRGQTWDSTNALPFFGPVANIIVHKGEIYATSFSLGIVKSSDAGVTWKDISGGILPEVSDFCVKGELYASTLGDGIFKLNPASRDSWLPFSSGLSSLSANVNSIAGTGNSLVAGTISNGLYDYLPGNSTTWEERFLLGQLRPTEGVYDIINVHDSLFLSGHTGTMYLSTDNGLNWTVFGNRLTSINLTMVNARQAIILSRVIFNGSEFSTAFYYIKKDSLDKQFVNFSFVPGHFTYRLQIHGDKLWSASTTGLFYMPLSLLQGITADDSPGSVILPVHFVQFNALCVNNSSQLTWKTGGEHNSDHFNIERSSDGRNWIVIGRLAATGTGVTERSYSFTDINSPLNCFYRVVEIDDNNNIHYSEIRESTCPTTATVSIWPNPVQSTVLINIVSESQTQAVVRLFDSKGALVRRKSTQLMQGANQISIDVSAMPRGVYTLSVYWNKSESSKTIRLVKE